MGPEQLKLAIIGLQSQSFTKIRSYVNARAIQGDKMTLDMIESEIKTVTKAVSKMIDDTPE